MRHADGHWVWVQDTSVPCSTSTGESQFFQGFLVDVSKRHAAEERLREAEERFRVLVERMPAMVYTEPLRPGSTVPDGDRLRQRARRAGCSGTRPSGGRRARTLARGDPSR